MFCSAGVFFFFSAINCFEELLTLPTTVHFITSVVSLLILNLFFHVHYYCIAAHTDTIFLCANFTTLCLLVLPCSLLSRSFVPQPPELIVPVVEVCSPNLHSFVELHKKTINAFVTSLHLN